MLKELQISKLKNEIDYLEKSIEQVVLRKNENLTMVLMSFDKETEIPEHSTKGEVFINCLEGKGKITIESKEYIIQEGEYFLIPKKVSHSVSAIDNFKMLLTIIN